MRPLDPNQLGNQVGSGTIGGVIMADPNHLFHLDDKCVKVVLLFRFLWLFLIFKAGFIYLLFFLLILFIIDFLGLLNVFF